MKRRELLTAFSSMLAMSSINPLSSQAAENNPTVFLADTTTNDPPTDYIVILSLEDVYIMPDLFWNNLNGNLYVGKVGTDPTQSGNLINLYLRDAAGNLTQVQQPLALNKGKYEFADNLTLVTDSSNPSYSMAIVDTTGYTQFNLLDATSVAANNFSHRLTLPTGNQLVGDIPSVDVLRLTRPQFSGAKISLRSWHEGAEAGGGEFIGSLTAATDDGGVIFSSGEDFHWRREVENFNQLTLFDFGAIDDGKTDTAPAIQAMYNWAQNTNQQVSVQFPSGTFFISDCDFSQLATQFLRISGAMVNFGYFPSTTIVSDGKSDFIFKTNTRWVEISNLQFNGGNDKSANQQGFFSNLCEGGQYFRGSCLHFVRVGGTALSLIDTLDCKIDQWYALYCSGDVIKTTWSGDPKGNWDHCTAIELSNFNAQYCTNGKVLNLPRCTQSLIHNGWIEHTEFPGDISNGQWIIDALSMEDCKNPLVAHYARLNMRQINLQTGGSIDTSQDGSEWLSAFERGSVQVESYGMVVNGSMKYNHLTSCYRIENNTNQLPWVALGNIYTSNVGDAWEIEIFGQSTYGNNSDKVPLTQVMSNSTTGGKAIINLQRKVSKFEASWHAEGSSPIMDVMIMTPDASNVQVFIKLCGWMASAGVLIKTAAKDRFTTGACGRFDSNMAFVQAPAGNNVSRVVPRFSLHNGTAGIGANETGDLLVASRSLTADQVTADVPAGFVSIVLNGTQVAIPYFSIK